MKGGRFVFDDFKKFITNYYAYSFFFMCKGTKNKTTIDQTIIKILFEEDDNQEVPVKINRLIGAIKDLRQKTKIDYRQFQNFDAEKIYALYSLIDYYKSTNNFLSNIYIFPEFNKEHLILHDNRGSKINWSEETYDLTIEIKPLLEKTFFDKSKKNVTNYLILPSILNESLGCKDIIEKIKEIKDYFNNLGIAIPHHVNAFLNNIKQLPEFDALKSLKGQNAPKEKIIASYKEFIMAYFSEDNKEYLYKALENALDDSFKN